MMHYMSRFLIIGIFMLAGVFIARGDYDLSWSTIDGGGQMWSTGGGYELGGTVGQPDAGVALTGGGWTLTGGFWPGGAPSGPMILRGDLNCDGAVDFADINAFVLYLSNFSVWQATYLGCPPENGDIDADGNYPSFADINPFIALLTGGH